MQNLGNIIPINESVLIDDVLVKATGTLTSNNTNVTNAKKVTVGTAEYVFKTNITAKVRATQTLTTDGTTPTDGDIVTIDGVTYTAKEELTPFQLRDKHPYEVLIGASAATFLDNLKLAINKGAGEGVNYSLSTPAHPTVTAEANNDTTQVVQAIAYGTGGNSIAVSATSENTTLSWGDTVLAGGVNGVPNEIKIGTDANDTLANIKLAFEKGTGEGTKYGWGTVANADVTLGAVNTTNHTILFTAVLGGLAGNIASTTDEATLSWTGNTLAGGGGTSGIYTIAKGGGLARHFTCVAPQFTGSPTYSLTLKNAAGDIVKALAATSAENATVDTAYEVMLSEGDQIVLTTSGTVEDNLPIELHIR